MNENEIPLRVSWTTGNRRAHGYLHVAPDALHLICLREESETAARAGQAAAQQFGLIGGLIGAGVSAAREAKRKKELLEVYRTHQTLGLEQRLAQHPLSRTVTRAEVVSLKKGPHLAPTLQLASGPLAMEPADASTSGAIESWAATHQVKVEFVEAPKFPWKVIGIIFAIPVVLLLLHLIISLPYALKLMKLQHEAIAVRTAFVTSAEQAYATIAPPAGGEAGTPLATACKSVFAGHTPADAMGFVGALPAEAKKLATRDYEGFPRLAFPEQPYFKGAAPKLDSQLVADRWATPIGFGSAYGRVVGSPLEWSRVASRLYGQPAAAPELSLVGKVQRFEARGSSARVQLTVKVLDAAGKQVCEGDLALSVRSSSGSLGFALSQGVPLGLYLPLCKGERSGSCRDVSSYATLAE